MPGNADNGLTTSRPNGPAKSRSAAFAPDGLSKLFSQRSKARKRITITKPALLLLKYFINMSVRNLAGYSIENPLKKFLEFIDKVSLGDRTHLFVSYNTIFKK